MKAIQSVLNEAKAEDIIQKVDQCLMNHRKRFFRERFKISYSKGTIYFDFSEVEHFDLDATTVKDVNDWYLSNQKFPDSYKPQIYLGIDFNKWNELGLPKKMEFISKPDFLVIIVPYREGAQKIFTKRGEGGKSVGYYEMEGFTFKSVNHPYIGLMVSAGILYTIKDNTFKNPLKLRIFGGGDENNVNSITEYQQVETKNKTKKGGITYIDREYPDYDSDIKGSTIRTIYKKVVVNYDTYELHY